MNAILSTTERMVATSELEAEAIVKKRKEDNRCRVKSHTITKKSKNDKEYFVINVTVEFTTLKDVLTDLLSE